MEDMVMKFGFGVFCFFFMLAMLVQTVFAWGCLAGLVVILFGWFFAEE